jgi:putative redox protein
MKRVTSITTLPKNGYQTSSSLRQHKVIMDRPFVDGGSDTSASPIEYLLAALGSCISITIRVFANKKGWDLGEIKVNVKQRNKLNSEGLVTWFEEDISFENNLTVAQKEELRIAAEKCPVAQLLKNESKIKSIIL